MVDDICPLTKEYIDSLSGLERAEALRAYHDWLRRARKNDKRLMHNYLNRIYSFKNRKKLKGGVK